jgi:hypothetical protein
VAGERDVQVTVKVAGVTMPAWAAVLLTLAFVFSAVALLIYADAAREQAREIRVLQLHAQDIESVLIQQGLAKRQDFAPWGPDAPTHDVNREPER